MAGEATGSGTEGIEVRGASMHIGLNFVDTAHYGGWDGQLGGCINDANAMSSLAESRRFETASYIDAEATAEAVIDGISRIARELAPGDIFFLTYSGHGGQLPDTNSEEDDHLDETWCLWDRELVDDELWSLWAKFEPGVRVVVLSDSCHSGTVTRERAYRDVYLPHTAAIGAAGTATADQIKTRNMPKDVEKRTYMAHKEMYDGIQQASPRGERNNVGADILLISGCADNQLSGDTANNGVFTGNLLRVWQQGAFEGSYQDFYQELSNIMPASQSPNYYRVGSVDEAFDRQAPFSI